MMRYFSLLLLSATSLAFAEPEVFIQVLGIAQDAGYPQTSCYQQHCLRAWQNREHRRLASSIAVVDTASKSKYLFDATPDMRAGYKVTVTLIQR